MVKSKELAFDNNSHVKYAFAKGESFAPGRKKVGKDRGKFYLLPTVFQHGNLSLLTFVYRVKVHLKLAQTFLQFKHSRFVSTATLRRLITACDELISTSIVADV